MTGQTGGMELANLLVGIVGTLATVGALVYAVHVGLREARQFREEAQVRDAERREEELRRRRAQAECVSAVAKIHAVETWDVSRQDVARLMDEGRVELTSYGLYVDVTNASSLPIYDCKVAIWHDDKSFTSLTIGYVPGQGVGHAHYGRVKDDSADGQPVDVAFRDSGGTWWLRHPNGQLHEPGQDPWPDSERPEDDEHGDAPAT